MGDRQDNGEPQWQQQAAGYAPPGGDAPPQYQAPQPRRSRRRIRTWLLTIAALIIGIAIGAAGSSSGSSKTAAAPAVTVTVTATATPKAKAGTTKKTTAAPAASPASAPAAAGQTIATFTGSGIQKTARFTVSGTWKLAYSFDCSSFGSQGNFQVYEDGGSDFNGVTVNDLAMSKAGTTWAYNDAGTHYLEVNSECAWTVKVINES